MKNTQFIVLFAVAALLAGCNSLMKDYDFDTNADALKDTYMIDYFETQWDKSNTTYCEVVRRLDLLDLVQSGNKTRIVPTNAAFNTLFMMMGVSGLDDVDPVVMRELMLYLIVDGEYRSRYLDANVNYEASTASGNEMYIKRKPTGGNDFIIYLNDDPAKISGGPTVVSVQDYYFKDGVAQVVGAFPYFQPLVPSTEPTPEGLVVRRDTLWVAMDTHINSTDVTKNYNNLSTGMQTTGRTKQFRYGIVKFPLDQTIPYKNNLASATINCTLMETDWPAQSSCALDFFELNDVSWNERTVTYNSFPGFPASYLNVLAGKAEFTVPTKGALWTADPKIIISPGADILASMVRHYANPTLPDSIAYCFIDGSPGVLTSDKTTIRVCNRFNCPDPGPYRTNRMFIALSEAMVSQMRLKHNNALQVVDGSATLNTGVLAMQGPAVPNGYNYTDNNIVYLLNDVPADGVLTKNGIPMVSNTKFTQAEMGAGCIRYLRTNAASASDSFTVKATDYLGGVYNGPGTTDDLLTINVQ